MADTASVLVVKDGETPSVVRSLGGVVDDAGTFYPAHISRSVPLAASTAVEGAHVFRTAAADVYAVSATGLTTFAWLLLFDASSVPADGAVLPSAAIQATQLAGTSISFGGIAAAFQTGVVAVLSSTGPFLKTSGPTGFLSALVR